MANAVSAPGSNIARSSSGRALPMCRRPAPQSGRNIAPFKTGANVRFPPFAHSAYGCLGDRRRGQSVENAPPLSLRSGWGHPDCVSIHIIGNRPPLDQWHGVDGVIHALSTATIPSQSSRGGQRVANPPPRPTNSADARLAFLDPAAAVSAWTGRHRPGGRRRRAWRSWRHCCAASVRLSNRSPAGVHRLRRQVACRAHDHAEHQQQDGRTDEERERLEP